ncbi:hypothetical protein CYMTET_25779 [Cymbomonas tetramitiformis]|uniref:Uncharacterized protein n=1 Tax=Cymbomonas tetramitiformis TaxID=36881 RepID=A0AAE0FT61_9CHLO|nr:hypothetical protein CYMTET_25779 [Cymbomonas tetramitiformis]KAK3265545.1 hypothetical protein CYMTET_25779 [Cymbomonas tetramitiformis]
MATVREAEAEGAAEAEADAAGEQVDRDDWMVCPVRWAELDQEFGPFTVDACVAESRANAYCYLSWSKAEDARVQKFDGHNAWGNLPFSIIVAIIKNFLKCKRRQQWGTAACFLVPVWPGNEGWELVRSLPEVFKVVREWAQGTHLFTAPDLRGHGRTAWGPTRGRGSAALDRVEAAAEKLLRY